MKNRAILRKAAVAVLLGILLLATVFGGHVLLTRSKGYSLQGLGSRGVFTDFVNGYRLQMDLDMAVDMTHADIVTVLENDRQRVEIYKQDVTGMSADTYIQYSNGFLANTTDHVLLYQGIQNLGGRDVFITSWQREKAARVDNDKNHYISMEIPEGDSVYTIFLKSADSLENLSASLYMAETFEIVKPSVAAAAWSSRAVDPEDRGWNQETQEYFETYFGEDAVLNWGIFEPDVAWGTFDQVAYYEQTLDYQFPVLLCYSAFINETTIGVGRVDIEAVLTDAWNRGKVLELTLQTTVAPDGGNYVYDILQGEFDEYLYAYAQSIADFGHPVLFRLFNEMNGDWCPYSGYNTSKDTLMYQNAYWYVYSIFDQTGANANTIWIWNPNEASYPGFDWNHSLMYYPGDAYVDVVGMTAYNTGTYYAEVGETWKDFTTLYDGLYHEYCTLYAQPLMITEFACANMGGDKNAWVEDMFLQLPKYDRIKMAVWWDHQDFDAEGNVARSYVLDETPELLEIFRKNLHN